MQIAQLRLTALKILIFCSIDAYLYLNIRAFFSKKCIWNSRIIIEYPLAGVLYAAYNTNLLFMRQVLRTESIRIESERIR